MYGYPNWGMASAVPQFFVLVADAGVVPIQNQTLERCGQKWFAMKIMLRQLCSFVLCGLVAVVMGCGGSATGNVSSVIKGKVTYQGAPVTEGIVTFVNVAGNAGGQIDIKSDGTFELTKLLPQGEYLVAVVPPQVDAPSTGSTAPGKIAKQVKNIPPTYRSTTSSNIKFEIKGGKADVNIDMK